MTVLRTLAFTFSTVILRPGTTEYLNYQQRKIVKNRGPFPNDDAVVKLLWLAIGDIEDKRARARAKAKGIPKSSRKKIGRIEEGATTQTGQQH